MKTRITSALAILLVFFSAITMSCENESGNVTGTVFYDAGSKKSFSLDDPDQLNHVARLLANEPTEFKMLKSASVVNLRDRKGDFKAISVSYNVGGNVTSLIVPIVEAPAEKNGSTYYVVESCAMKCIATGSSNGCTQQIIERCVSQTCASSGDTGTCTSSVTFKD